MSCAKATAATGMHFEYKDKTKTGYSFKPLKAYFDSKEAAEREGRWLEHKLANCRAVVSRAQGMMKFMGSRYVVRLHVAS